MWMFYAEQSWSKAVDLKSSVERLYSELCALKFEADHETVYNFRVFTDSEEVRHLRQLAENYSEASEVCSLYLDNEISLECVYYEFSKLDLLHMLHSLKHFTPEELHNKFCDKEDSST